MAEFLPTESGRRPTLPELLAAGEMVLAPGCYDALGARLIEEAGFSAVYMTGFGTSAGLLGRPDVGLVTLSEMVDNARRIVEAVDIPVIADADTGYGNPINVIRTVREYEDAGVAALHIEDQVMPKKCGHMEGKHVVPAAEMVEKVRAAVDARRLRTSSSSPGPTRAPSRGSTRPSSARARYRRGRRGRPVHRGAAVGGGDRGDRRRVPRRAAPFQLRRGRQDPADDAALACASSATRS